MSLDANALTTLQAVKDYLEIEEDQDNGKIEDFINRATGILESILNRKLKHVNASGTATAITEYFNGGKKTLFLKYYPIISVTSVHEDPDRTYGADTLVDSDDYAVYEDEGMIRLDSGTFASGNKAIKVVYTGGYTSSTLPYALEQLAIKITALMWKEKDNVGVNTKTFADGSMSYFENRLTPQERSVLEKYSKRDH